MTSHKQDKKKQRERLAKERVLRRRVGLRKRREEDAKREEAITFKPPKMKPIRNNQTMSPEEVQKRLEHNHQILKALEEEYEKETGQKKDFTEHFDKLKGFAQAVEDSTPVLASDDSQKI